MIRRLQAASGLLLGQFTPFLKPYWGAEEYEVVARWMTSNSGKEVESDAAVAELVTTAKQYYGTGCHILPVNSGRTAILVALEALLLPPGCEVLLSAFSCAGVIAPVIQAGLKPVLVDVDDCFNMSLESAQEVWSPQVRAVILPHLAGLWCRDTFAIVDWARREGIAVIEDVAQATGLCMDGRPAGTFGDVGIFSAGGGKPLFGPGGGWLITGHADIIEHVRRRPLKREPRETVARRLSAFVETYGRTDAQRSRLRLRQILSGWTPQREAVIARPAGEAMPRQFMIGVAEIAPIEARLAILQFQKLDAIVAGRQANAQRWRDRLAALALPSLHVPPARGNISSKMWIYFVGVSAMSDATVLARALAYGGIETEVLYVPLHRRPELGVPHFSTLTNTECQSQHVFSVPVRPNLTEADWWRIDAALAHLS